MDEAVAYSTLAMTVTLAVSRPRVGLREIRFTPGSAALAGVIVLLMAGLLTVDDMVASAAIQWRPLLSLTSIMVMTGVVQEVGAFDRLAQWVEAHARRTSAARTFTLVFLVSVVTPSLLNNDSAILLLTPLVVALARRLYPGRPGVVEAFAFAVFLAPGVAPLVISNPMNMIVAEFAGVGFNAYARTMVPIALAGALLTYVVLRLVFRTLLASAVAAKTPVAIAARHPAEKPAVFLLLAVFCAYPLMATLGGQIWTVAVCGAAVSLLLAWRYRVAPAKKVLAHVSPDILVFLWGVFLVVAALRNVGLVDRLASVYQASPSGSAHELGVVGVVAALGSAVVDNHPMSILNMMALGAHGGSKPLLAALVGGDIGPRLLPIGSLAGLLWMDLLRRQGVEISIGKFVKLGTLVLLPTLAVSLVMLHLLYRIASGRATLGGMDRFEGFADADARFFKALARHQDRAWFAAHKAEFEQGWNAPMKALLTELHAAIDSAYPHCDLDEPKVFRIFRDVRFAKDKSPYKTHIAGYVPTKRSGKAVEAPAALYAHFGVESVVAAGHYMMDGTALARFRAAVVDDARGKELAAILAKLAKKGYRAESHESLKRVPKGFDPDHPRAELLKRKGLIVTFPKVPKGMLAKRALLGWLVKGSKDVAPLVEWLVFATA